MSFMLHFSTDEEDFKAGPFASREEAEAQGKDITRRLASAARKNREMLRDPPMNFMVYYSLGDKYFVEGPFATKQNAEVRQAELIFDSAFILEELPDV